MGIVVDLKDMSVRTPEQVIRVFYELYDAADVKEKLFQVFARLAISEIDGIPALEGVEHQVIQLFDQLTFLGGAIEKLRQGDTEAAYCAICGTKRTITREEE